MNTLVNRPKGDAQTAYAELFTPLRVGGGLSLPNRLAVALMTRVSATAYGHATKQMADYYEAFAAGGFGLVITEGLYTDKAHAQGYPKRCQPMTSPRRSKASHKRRAERRRPYSTASRYTAPTGTC